MYAWFGPPAEKAGQAATAGVGSSPATPTEDLLRK